MTRDEAFVYLDHIRRLGVIAVIWGMQFPTTGGRICMWLLILDLYLSPYIERKQPAKVGLAYAIGGLVAVLSQYWY